MNVAPAGFTLDGGIAKGFTDFFLPLHKRFTPDAQRLTRERAQRLARAHAGDLPSYLPQSEASESNVADRAPDLVHRPAQSNDRTGR